MRPVRGAVSCRAAGRWGSTAGGRPGRRSSSAGTSGAAHGSVTSRSRAGVRFDDRAPPAPPAAGGRLDGRSTTIRAGAAAAPSRARSASRAARSPTTGGEAHQELPVGPLPLVPTSAIQAPTRSSRSSTAASRASSWASGLARGAGSAGAVRRSRPFATGSRVRLIRRAVRRRGGGRRLGLMMGLRCRRLDGCGGGGLVSDGFRRPRSGRAPGRSSAVSWSQAPSASDPGPTVALRSSGPRRRLAAADVGLVALVLRVVGGLGLLDLQVLVPGVVSGGGLSNT